MVFSIKKGNHFSNRFIHKILSFFNINRKMIYMIKFDESALYSDDTLDRYDVNKLFGFSIGMHHNNSYRFGWNCLNNEIHIYAYLYVEGKRIINEIGVIKINETHKFIIYLNGSKCIFSVTDSKLNLKQVIFNVKNKKVFGYNLWPYFGGNKTATQNINIEMTKIITSY